MKKNRLIVSGLFLVGIAGLLFKYKDHLPPRTPLKIARIQSGLDIPKSVQIIDFREEYSFSGEGYIYVLIKLDERALQDMTQECLKKKYRELTIKNLVSDKFIQPNTAYGIKLYDKDITSIEDGYYKLDSIDLNKLDFGIAVIDNKKRELLIYVNIP